MTVAEMTSMRRLNKVLRLAAEFTASHVRSGRSIIGRSVTDA